MKKNRRRVPIARTPDSDSAPRTTKSRSSNRLLQVQSGDGSVNPSAPAVSVGPEVPSVFFWSALVAAMVALVWSFWPAWVSLIATWEREPDYSHGWFVIPIGIYLLWNFRDSMPATTSKIHLGGLILLASTIGLRLFARWAYFDFMDGWMIPLSIIGIVWAFAGPRWAWWAMPALAFLFFMVPLPFRIENELSRPLQWFATKSSCFVLQLLGQPAIPEGTTILLGDEKLEVERACSGLRIFMGVFALSYVYAFLVRRVWWERLVLVLAAVPIALAANATRIIVTGLLYQLSSSVDVRRLIHDWAGYAMIGFAAILFGLTLLYMRWLLPDLESMESAA
ncbi:MAG: exosortase, partial [Planctomycetes bacterium]|nr:exosortase [Planctomycetota bacterium]